MWLPVGSGLRPGVGGGDGPTRAADAVRRRGAELVHGPEQLAGIDGFDQVGVLPVLDAAHQWRRVGADDDSTDGPSAELATYPLKGGEAVRAGQVDIEDDDVRAGDAGARLWTLGVPPGRRHGEVTHEPSRGGSPPDGGVGLVRDATRGRPDVSSAVDVMS
jgi:hypothetical protein